MLQTLNIENVALIDKATLNFDCQLNVISGETGAGKSIMLDSLSFVFGGRADKSLIRSGEKAMKVEAIFSCLDAEHIYQIKEHFGIDVSDELFISRELDETGKNTCKINGELVPVAVLKQICATLVDIHGQSEHLAILNNDYQLRIIDLFDPKTDLLLQNLNTLIDELHCVENEIKNLGGSEDEKRNLIDLYSYQIKEIENANITPQEFESLTEEKKTMQQFEKINEALKNYLSLCENNPFEPTSVDKLTQGIKEVQSIANVNDHFAEILSRLQSCMIELRDVNDTVSDDLDKNIFDQERFDYIDARLDEIKSLFRKYGGDFDSLQSYFEKTKISLENLLNSTEKYNELTEKKNSILLKIDEKQAEISELRQKSAKVLNAEIERELKVLGMPNAKMSIEFTRTAERYTLTGFDRVEFMFSANLGFELKPLNKVVSGGEMSRVMLAYKIVVSSVDNISTIIFDEVDSGLSGNIASVVAEYMARLSRKKQVIAVSHLPQICAMADNNVKVEKYSDEKSTHTKSTILKDENLLKEIARLMGAEVDETGLLSAKNLKDKSTNYKLSL